MTDRSRPLTPDDFGMNSVEVLLELDAVRHRAGLYIGDTDDGTGLHNMVYAIVDNAIAELRAGHADLITVTLNPDGSVAIADNGRGMPTDIDRREGLSAAELIMTRLHMTPLHAAEDVAPTPHAVSGGLQGIGASTVNAVAQWLTLRIRRGGKEHAMAFAYGDPTAPLRVVGDCGDRHGTEIAFLPASGIFTRLAFDARRLDKQLRARALRNPGGRIVFTDARGPRAA